jgi:hypothetical protein
MQCVFNLIVECKVSDATGEVIGNIEYEQGSFQVVATRYDKTTDKPNTKLFNLDKELDIHSVNYSKIYGEVFKPMYLWVIDREDLMKG